MVESLYIAYKGATHLTFKYPSLFTFTYTLHTPMQKNRYLWSQDEVLYSWYAGMLV